MSVKVRILVKDQGAGEKITGAIDRYSEDNFFVRNEEIEPKTSFF